VWREGKKLKEEYIGRCDQYGDTGFTKQAHRRTDSASWQEQFKHWQETRQKSKRNKSPHEILGIPYTATPEQVKAAYQKLVKQFHPDLNPAIDPTIIVDINKAYQSLTQ
jgi:hypothetical protein